MPLNLEEKTLSEFPAESFIYDSKKGKKRCLFQNSGEDKLFKNSMDKDKMSKYMQEHDGPFYIFMDGEQHPRKITANEDGTFSLSSQLDPKTIKEISEEKPPKEPKKPNIFSRAANRIKQAFGGDETDRFKRYHEEMDEYDDALNEFNERRKMAKDCFKLKQKHDKNLDKLEKITTSKTKLLGDRELSDKIINSRFRWRTAKSANKLLNDLAKKSIERFNEKLRNFQEGPDAGDRQLKGADLKEDLANMLAISVALSKIKNCKSPEQIKTAVANIAVEARTIKANLEKADPKSLEADLNKMKAFKGDAIKSGAFLRGIAKGKLLKKTNSSITKKNNEAKKQKEKELENSKKVSKSKSKSKEKKKDNLEITSQSMTY